MIRLPIPLFAQVLLWLAINLVAIAVTAFALLGGGLSWESLVKGPLGDRPQAIAGSIASELAQSDPDTWSALLARHGYEQGLDLSLYRPNGTLIAGTPGPVPSEVRARFPRPLDPEARDARDRRRFDPNRDRPRDADDPARAADDPDRPLRRPFGGPGGPPGGPGAGNPADRVYALYAGETARYYFVVRIGLPAGAEVPAGGRLPAMLVAHTDSRWRFATFTGLARWAPVGVALALLSGLLWWPLVRSLNSTLRRITSATEAIADGRLETRVDVSGRDELTRLATAVNTMAGRLDRFVTDQRRFMGDVAHELASPVARAQMALDLLERKLTPGDDSSQDNLRDVREEVEQMGALVSELLTFSRAALGPRDAKLADVPLTHLAATVVERERARDLVRIDIPDGLAAHANEPLLARAVANLIRNAVRYAGHAGPITLTARPDGPSHVLLTVADVGPGVPPEALQRLGDAFYRPEAARTRETGGVGLGLAIVRTCAEACRATVAFENRSPQGFQATLRLLSAPAS